MHRGEEFPEALAAGALGRGAAGNRGAGQKGFGDVGWSGGGALILLHAHQPEKGRDGGERAGNEKTRGIV